MGLLETYIMRDLPRPKFLSGRAISAYVRGFGQAADLVSQAILDARKEWTVKTATLAALRYLARNRNDRSFELESPRLVLAEYLLDIIAQKRKAGTTDGLIKQFSRIGCDDIEIVTELDLRNAGAVNPFGGNIGFFFILVKQPHPFPVYRAASWDDGIAEWDDEVTRWGWSGTTNDLSEIADILRRWKPSGTSCRFIVFDDDGTAGWGAGGLTGNYSLIAYNESWEKLPPSGAVSFYYNSSFLVA